MAKVNSIGLGWWCDTFDYEICTPHTSLYIDVSLKIANERPIGRSRFCISMKEETPGEL